MVAEKQGLDKDYVENASERDIRAFYPTTIGVRFSASTFFINQSVELFTEQTKVIRELASKGDCVIVGRCADVLLNNEELLNIFVYADKESKIKRCLERAKEGEKFSDKDIEKKMKERQSKANRERQENLQQHNEFDFEFDFDSDGLIW